MDFHDVVPSTMDLARSFDASRQTHHWIIAKSQTKARGRRGRTWLSEQGSFAGTCVFDPDCTPLEAAQRSFVAAVALTQALAEFVDPKRLSQKWPNDVLLSEKKIAGILLESSTSQGRVNHLAIGLGVNLGRAPDTIEGALFQPTGLAEYTDAIAPEVFGPVIAREMMFAEERYKRDGFVAVRAEWLAKAARLGDEIKATTATETLHGTFETVDMDGNLVLLTPTGRRVIPAADVFF